MVPGSQAPAWEPISPKLCFDGAADEAEFRGDAFRSRSFGTGEEPAFPKLCFDGDANEAELRGDAFRSWSFGTSEIQ
jgi:hypothetical protein